MAATKIRSSMAADKTLISSELLKLKKEQLIEIIVYKRLTSEVPKTSNLLIQKFISENLCYNKETEEFSDASDTPIIDINNLQNQLLLLKSQSEGASKLIFHLEKRLLDQEQLISLLNVNNNKEYTQNPRNEPPCHQISAREYRNLPKLQASTSKTNTDHNKYTTPNGVNLNPTAKNHSSKQTTTPDLSYKNVLMKNHKNDKEISLTGQQKTFVSKEQVRVAVEGATQKLNSHKQTIKGTGTKGGNIDIKTVPPQGHLSVYRCHPETTQEDLTAFLKETASDIPFLCKLVKSNEYESAFKVSFPMDYIQEVYDPDIWPKGASVCRFKFQSRNFQRMERRKKEV